MMSLKSFSAVAIIALAVPAYVDAQPPAGARGGGMQAQQARMRDMLMEGITLTPEQNTKVDSIQAASAEERREIMQSAMAGGDREAAMAQGRELATKQYAAIRAVLTPEQQSKFDENVKKMPAARGMGGMGAGRRGPPSAR